MAGPRRILCLIGTRPEAIKMAPVVLALRAAGFARVTVLGTGQHRDMARQALSLFGIDLDVDLDVMQPDQSLAGLAARVLARLDAYLAAAPQDMILVQGDTTSVMAGAMAGFCRRIPVGHVEAGLRTHDIDRPFPEEMNRRIASLASALHFAPTAGARDNLLREGVAPSAIHVTGNTVIDALLAVARQQPACDLPIAPGRRLVLVTAHRRETLGEKLRAISRAVLDLHARFPDVEFAWPVHPNPRVAAVVRPLLGGLDRVHLVPPADYDRFVGLLLRASLVLTDSGGVQEEAPALGRPVLVLREETERPEAVEAGVARLVGTDRRRIVAAASALLDDPAEAARMTRGGSPFGDGQAAARIAALCRCALVAPAMAAE